MAYRLTSRLKLNKDCLAICRCLSNIRTRQCHRSTQVKSYSMCLGYNLLKQLRDDRNDHFMKNRCNTKNRIHTSSSCQGKILPFNLSDIGEGIAEVTIKEWYVEEGSSVNQFDSICEVQSDKASVTITSKFDGVVRKLYYSVEDVARVGKALVDIEVSDGEEAEVDEDGEHLLTDEPATPPLPDVDRAPSIVAAPPVVEEKKEASSPQTRGEAKMLATPAVRRLAMEHNINLADVTGTGKDGRVLKEDIIKHLEKPSIPTTPIVSRAISVSEGLSAPSEPPITSHAPVLKPPSVYTAEDRTESITGIRKVMVKSMNDALSIPHFGYCDEINADSLIRARQQMKKDCEKYGVKLSYMPFFIKATSLAMLKYPVLNSCLNLEDFTITYKGSHNIGVAMDTADGLIVPNVKNVQDKTLLEIASELNRLHELGISGKLGPADLTNSTMTLSNIGSISGTYAHPVIVPPAVAIAAIGQIKKIPMFDENEDVYPANIFNISWSADHRVIDGATMARFSNLWKSYIENPESMLLHLK